MNGAQIAAYFEQHKPVVLGVAAAGVAGLALVQRKKKAGGSGAVDTSSSGGAIPAAAVVPASGNIGGAYDSSTYDLYNALQPTLEAILQQQTLQTGTSSGITTPPKAPSSAITNPKNGIYKIAGDDSNKLFKVNNGTIDIISHDEYYAMGNTNKTKRTYVSKDDPMWNNLQWLDASKAAQQAAGKKITVTPIKKPAPAPAKKK